MGTCVGTANEVRGALNEVRRSRSFGPGTYNLVRRNCNHFSDALCQHLVGAPIPAWINRAAGLGAALGASVKGFQVAGEPIPAGSEAQPAAPQQEEEAQQQSRGFFSSLGWGSGAAPKTQSSASTTAEDPRTKKKVLTAKQKEALARLKSAQ